MDRFRQACREANAMPTMIVEQPLYRPNAYNRRAGSRTQLPASRECNHEQPKTHDSSSLSMGFEERKEMGSENLRPLPDTHSAHSALAARLGRRISHPLRHVRSSRATALLSGLVLFALAAMAAPAQAQSSDATLRAINVAGGTLKPSFSSTNYTYFVERNAPSILLGVNKNHDQASVRITPDDNRGTPEQARVGTNNNVVAIRIRVTAEDGTTRRTYTIYVLKERPAPLHAVALPTGASLSSLALSAAGVRVTELPGPVDPGKDCGCATYYLLEVPRSTNRISVFATANSGMIEIFSGSQQLTGAVAAASLQVGRNEILVNLATGGNVTEIHRLVVWRGDTPPVLQDVYTNGGNVSLHYNDTLFPSALGAPPASAFTVTSAGTAVAVSHTSVLQNVLHLAMSSAVGPPAEIRVSYTVPDENPIRSSSRGVAASFSNRLARPYGPRLSVDDVTVMEGDDNTADFTVTLKNRTIEEVRVDYATSDGTATAGEDYRAKSGTLVFRPTDVRGTIRIPIIDDSIEDSGETFTLTLSNARGAGATIDDATATATINNEEEEGEEEESAALTAEFRSVPTAHEDEEFDVELHFSETLNSDFSYTTLEDVLSITNGELDRVSRIAREGDNRNKQWRIQVTPDAGEDVTINLAASSELSTDDDVTLSSPVSTTIAGPEPPENQPDLTVRFTSGHEPPATHNGSSEFSFQIEFSEEPHDYSYKTLRDHTLDIRQGDRITPKVRRVTTGSSQRWEVTVTPTSAADMTIRVNETSNCNDDGAVCTEDDRMLSNGLGRTVTGPPGGFSVADARVSEGSDVTLDFVVTLSRSLTGTETVDYETVDGTASAGADYTAQSGTLSFSPGETSKTVAVPILDDSHDEGNETLTLRLSNASTSVITDNAATGTIENHDPLPRALMARFGRTAAVHVVEQIEERLAAPREPGFDGTIAGRQLRRGMERDVARQFLSQFAGARATPPGLNSTQAAIPGATGTTGPMGIPGQQLGAMGTRLDADTLGPSARAMQMRGAGAGGALLNESLMGLGVNDLLTGSGFALNRQTQDGGTLSFWSRGAQSSFFGQEGEPGLGFFGQEGELGLDGDVRTAMFGADYSKGPMVVGLSLANSRGVGSSAGVDLGQVASSVTGLYPWIGYQATERVTIWGLAGYGGGALRLSPETSGALEGGLSMKMAATGTRGDLISGRNGFALAFKADALWVGTTFDGVNGVAGRLAATTATVTRFRTGLEGSRNYSVAGRMSVKPIVEIALRHDGGDAETGTGMDVGGGIALADAATGLAVNVRVQMLAMHQAEGFRERGMAVSLRYNSRPSTPFGFQARIVPSWGGEAVGGTDALWYQESMGSPAYGDRRGNRLDGEVSYGLPVGDRLIGTPRFAIRTSEYGRDYRLGFNLGLLERESTSFSLGIDLHQRESPMLGDARGFVRATLGW